MKKLLIPPAALAFLLGAFGAAANGLTISDPWVRAAPPNAPALGAFMAIENTSDSERYIVEARTDLDTERVELHRTMMQDGVMQMVPHSRIPLAPGSKTMLEPGSWHVMLIGPKKVPVEGDKLRLTLAFDDGTEKTVEAVVRKGKKMMHGHKHEHGHKHKHKHGHKQTQEHGGKHGGKNGCGQMQGQHKNHGQGHQDCAAGMQGHGQKHGHKKHGHEGKHGCGQMQGQHKNHDQKHQQECVTGMQGE